MDELSANIKILYSKSEGVLFTRHGGFLKHRSLYVSCFMVSYFP